MKAIGYAVVIQTLVVVGGCRLNDPAPIRWNSVSAGPWYSCGLAAGGVAFCWGGTAGSRIELQPDSAIANSAVPVRVAGGHRFKAISVGEGVICGIDDSDEAFCWGANQQGSVGDGSFVSKRGPSRVVGSEHWRMLAAGGSTVCGITLQNLAYCWGNGFRGALGSGTAEESSSQPVPVSGSLRFTSLSAGAGTTCALTENGDAYCWGVNDNGKLGDGTPPQMGVESSQPVAVTGGLQFQSLTVGNYNVCGIAIDARGYCWGYGGMLGNGSSAASSTPTPISGDRRWRTLSSGVGFTCGLTTDDTLYCWGNNDRGQFAGAPAGIALDPILVPQAGNYSAIEAGGQHVCARTSSAVLLCWGRGDQGQLGSGSIGDRSTPLAVASGR